MVSYKRLYENLQNQIKESNEPVKSGFLCPKCSSEILHDNSEFFCSNENCSFDKIFLDLIESYGINNNLERVD